jgi:hypothetical protein
VAAALVLRGDLDRERGERVRLGAVREEANRALEGGVDARRQSGYGPVPGEGDRVPVRERELAVLVVEEELEVAEVFVEPAPVLSEDVALLVVLGQTPVI